MSHTWDHRAFKRRYPLLSQYVKQGKAFNIADLPAAIIQPNDERGVSYDNLERRLKGMASQGHVTTVLSKSGK